MYVSYTEEFQCNRGVGDWDTNTMKIVQGSVDNNNNELEELSGSFYIKLPFI